MTHDLNIIKHVWDYLDRKKYERRPYNVDELIRVLWVSFFDKNEFNIFILVIKALVRMYTSVFEVACDVHLFMNSLATMTDKNASYLPDTKERLYLYRTHSVTTPELCLSFSGKL